MLGKAAVAGDTLRNYGAGILDQVGRDAAVERQFQNALVLHHGSDARGLRFHQRSVRLHRYLFAYVTDFERDVDGRVAGNLQDDSRLHRGGETLLAYVHAIRPDRKIGHGVGCHPKPNVAVRTKARIRVRYFDRRARNRRAGGIQNSSVDLRPTLGEQIDA